jgi:hypothetical protein
MFSLLETVKGTQMPQTTDLATLEGKLITAFEVIASDEDVATGYAVGDQIIARPETADEWIKLKLQVVVRQLRTAYEVASDGKPWDQTMDLIDALSGTVGDATFAPCGNA